MPNQPKRSGNSYKNYYSAYKAKYQTQRKQRLERHLNKFPNDEQAQAALSRAKKGDLEYRRKAPKSKQKMWTPERKQTAHLFRIAGMNGHKALITTQEELDVWEREEKKAERQNNASVVDEVL